MTHDVLWRPDPATVGDTKHRPGRKAGALVVLVDGAPVLYVERGGRSLLSFAVDRSQASFEELQAARAEAIGALVGGGPGAPSMEQVLASEPPRVPAPSRPASVPSPVHSPLTDPHIH